MTAFRRLGAGLAALGVAAAGLAAVVPSSSAASPGAVHRVRCPVVFSPRFAARIRHDFPRRRVTASVEDLRTGCRDDLHRGMRITTASVVKAQVLGAVLLHAQAQHRGLTAWERHRAYPMIRWSFNEPYVGDLYSDVGGVAAMNRFCRRMHAFHTVNTLEYGGTVTTARDRTAIIRRMLSSGGPLRPAYRRIAWHYLSHVTPTQRWGVTAGVPAGWRVALKNGFYPMSGHGWRVGSTGFLRAPGTESGLAVTIMTDQDANQVAGIHLVERVERHVMKVLTDGPPAPRIVDRARCLTAHSGQSWSQLAARLGTGDWQRVRRESGGNPSPLAGQRVCSPRLEPPGGTA